jgi:O-antigen/teichoic acid export membrane protein
MIGWPMVFGILAVASLFVPLFFGPRYEKVVILLQLFSLIIIPISVGNNIGIQYLIPVGREKDLTRSFIVGATVNFILNIFMITAFSSIGATISSVLAEVVVSSCQLWTVRHELPVVKYFLSMKNYLVSSIIMYVMITAYTPVFGGSPLLQLIYKITVGSVIYVACLIILKDQFANHVLQRITTRLRGA